jgi:hypothetical protein
MEDQDCACERGQQKKVRTCGRAEMIPDLYSARLQILRNEPNVVGDTSTVIAISIFNDYAGAEETNRRVLPLIE